MTEPTAIDRAVAHLEAWLETMRGPAGAIPYGGPVAHWWQQSLLYTGPGYDWRYEGILLGYLALWERTGEPRWLSKACRAGDNLLAAQLPGGHFPASAFEINPASAGTPHEAAADLGLLHLASALRAAGVPHWDAYLSAAEVNLRNYYLEKLWDPQARSFRDHPHIESFVPNKAATACLALFAWSKLTGEARWAEQYALPNLERILAHQVTDPGPLQGAIAQNSFGTRLVAKYMPYYIARCIPGLVQGYTWSGQERFLEAAQLALAFILRQQAPDGSLLPALYSGGQPNQWPRWLAGLGDVLLAGDALRVYVSIPDMSVMQALLLASQSPSGAFKTARGFSAHTGGYPLSLPDLRDILPVAGWCDKAFHFLAKQVSRTPLPLGECQDYKADCVFQGQQMVFHEDTEKLLVSQGKKTVYWWIKGEAWARQAAPAFWLH